MLVHLPRALKVFDILITDARFPAMGTRKVTIMLLSAARFSDLRWKGEAIARAKALTYDDSNFFLRCWAVTAESYPLRIQGDYTGSASVLEHYVS